MLQRAKEGTSSLDKQVAAMTTELDFSDFSRAQLATEKVSAFGGEGLNVLLSFWFLPPPSHSTLSRPPLSLRSLSFSRTHSLFCPSLTFAFPPASSSPPLPLVALALVY